MPKTSARETVLPWLTGDASAAGVRPFAGSWPAPSKVSLALRADGTGIEAMLWTVVVTGVCWLKRQSKQVRNEVRAELKKAGCDWLIRIPRRSW